MNSSIAFTILTVCVIIKSIPKYVITPKENPVPIKKILFIFHLSKSWRSLVYPFLSIYLFWIVHVNRIKPYMSILVWVLSFNRIFSKSIYIVTYLHFIPFYGWIVHCVYASQFVYPFIHPLMEIWGIFIIWLLGIELLWPCAYMDFFLISIIWWVYIQEYNCEIMC